MGQPADKTTAALPKALAWLPAPPPAVAGTFWALLTVLIWSAWPAYTRLSIVGQTLSPQDLVLLATGVHRETQAS